jgi:hypothetical protein
MSSLRNREQYSLITSHIKGEPQLTRQQFGQFNRHFHKKIMFQQWDIIKLPNAEECPHQGTFGEK